MKYKFKVGDKIFSKSREYYGTICRIEHNRLYCEVWYHTGTIEPFLEGGFAFDFNATLVESKRSPSTGFAKFQRRISSA